VFKKELGYFDFITGKSDAASFHYFQQLSNRAMWGVQKASPR